MRIALLHPGNMGVTVGTCAAEAGHQIGWLAAGRSAATQKRAQSGSFNPYEHLAELLDDSDITISVCPPDAAQSTAEDVARHNFCGLYVDANAVSPDTARSIAKTVEAAGASYVDAGIVGPPARKPGTTRIYLSGERSAELEPCFANTALTAIVMGSSQTAASALKMCYAAWTKGSAALLLSVAALAASEDVAMELYDEWALSIPDLAVRLNAAAAANAPKAWRFEGEMQEIATTYAANGLPAEFHQAAASIFSSLSKFKDCSPVPNLDEVIRKMVEDAAST
ncbi:MAG: 3-hydroxyisobutyrate dehydrogenase-like beta-hydroxyacid dehydrogenase [Gammaproteobacteria bacterium]|jgi:3-hydroxyisobutyrate dehydrogenase-like beta-hydroxyacid dehydrogenase